MAAINETQKSILKALNELKKPSGCGDIAKKAGFKVPQVMGKLRGLVKQGLAESPQKGKYVIRNYQQGPTQVKRVKSRNKQNTPFSFSASASGCSSIFSNKNLLNSCFNSEVRGV